MEGINTLLLVGVLGVVIWGVLLIRQLIVKVSDKSPRLTARQEVMGGVLSEEFLQAHLKLNETVKDLDQQFRDDLRATQKKLLTTIESTSTSVFSQEVDAYKEAIAEASRVVVSMTTETAQQLQTMRAKVEKDAHEAVEKEKQLLLHRFEDKLEDVFLQYLEEALGEGVDLGAQKGYILKQLDAHKAEMKRDINDEF